MKYLKITIFSIIATLMGDVEAQRVVVGGMVDEPLMGVRLRSFNNGGGDEVYSGIPSLGDPSNREQMQYNWKKLNHIEIKYSQSSDTLTVKLRKCSGDNDDDDGSEKSHYCGGDDDDDSNTQGNGGGSSRHVLHFHNWTYRMQTTLGHEFSSSNLVNMSITLYNRNEHGELSFENVQLNDMPLGGDYNIPPTSLAPTVDSWTITNTCFNDFKLTGFIRKEGYFSNSAELSKIEFNIGTATLENEDIFSNGFESCYNL